METDHLLVRACRGERVERVPVWAMRQAGRWDPEFRKLRGGLDFYEFSRNVPLAVQASLLPKRFGVDAIILFYDITTLAEAMGAAFRMVAGRGPVPIEPVRSPRRVAELASDPGPDSYRHVLGTLEAVGNRLAGELPVIVFAGAPFTLGAYCVGTGGDLDALGRFIKDEPVAWRTLTEKIADATVRFINTLCAHGADVFLLFDTWAGGLNEQEYARWAQPFHRRIFAACRQVPSILFVRECRHLELMVQSGADVVSLGTRHDLADSLRRYGGVSFQGNVDSRILAEGDPGAVAAATLRCLQSAGGHRHVLNLNHGLLPATPVENFAAFINAAKSFKPQ